MSLHSLRLRLILAYAGLIVLGFGGLALLVGQQISRSVEQDYERRMTDETILVSRGLAEIPWNYPDNPPTETELADTLSAFQLDANTRINLLLIGPDRPPTGDRIESPRQRPPLDTDWALPDELRQYPELVAASQNTVRIDRRENEDGQEMLFAAAPVNKGPQFFGYVQLSKPASDLQRAVNERWGVLGIGVLAITVIALLASTWLSTSLIRPLATLRDSALKLSRGELSHRIAYHGRDEIGAVADAFNQMANQVQTMIEEQRAFASNTSHELRTPLTTMRLRTEALRHDPTLDNDTQRQYILELDSELARLSGLVDDLVLLSRFDAGRAETGHEHIDMVRFAHSLHRTMVKQAAEQGLDLKLVIDTADPAPVDASLNHLTVVFRNIVDNAIKYTPAGGQITWRVTRGERAIVTTITDSGQGIDTDQLPHVFERFYRADKARSRAVPGSGLGLALAKSIVETYRGEIAVTSPGPGQGTVVTVRWPAATQGDLPT